MVYDHKKIEEKWKKYWEENKTYKSYNPGDDKFENKPKYYVLDMFPYPSGKGLHVGHPKGYTANDIIARYKKAKGYNVLHPMGWDAFGLPAENYAIKTGTHPRETTDKNIKNFRKQIKNLGISYDWDREIDTTDPEYYKWTQWIFLKMFEHGLAYEQDLPINYCPSCKTGLANEEVLNDFTCERCGTKVEKRKIRQWVLAITKYADRLLNDIDKLDWPESIKEMQRNWIGRSEGTQFKMEVVKEKNSEKNLNKKNEVCILNLIQVGYNHPANTSSNEHNNQKIIKINRKNHFAKNIDGFVMNGKKKILFNSKNILKHFKSKSLKEFRYRKNLLGAVYNALDKIYFDENNIGYFIVGKKVIRVILGKQSNDNYFIKSYYLADKFTQAYKKYLENLYEKIGKIEVYTTRIDTVFGMTYAVLAPDHKDVEKFITDEQKEVCKKYIEESKKKSDLDRTADNKEKTGVWTGSYVINPFNGKKVPLWIADYVLGNYGTGAVMAVPAHDERDFAFAKKYNLPIIQSITSKDGKEVELPFTDYGILVNSGEFNGLTSQEAKKVLTEYAEKQAFGFKKVNYKLRDWLFSRQRYWGEPIPLIHLDNEDIEKLPHITEEELKEMNQKIENYLKQKMRGATPDKQEGVAPLGNTANLSLVQYIIQNTKKIKSNLENIKLKSFLEIKILDGNEYIFNGRYLLEHFKYKKRKELNLRKKILNILVKNFDKLIFIGNYGLININNRIWLVVFEKIGDNKYNIQTYYELEKITNFLNTAYILKRLEKKGENISENLYIKNGKAQELIIGGKVFSKIYNGIYGKIVCDYNLPLQLPELKDFSPAGDGNSPLAKDNDFVNVKLADNLTGKRETNTMPQWGGSCWYYLRFMDPKNKKQLVAPDIEKYWGQVDSYVGGAEHAVLHLLYARFWHKFLYDIKVVSHDEPFYRLRNQGLITAYSFQNEKGKLIANDLVEEKNGKFYNKENGEELKQVIAKMSKSLKNVVNPDFIIDNYGADTLRLYEMYMSDFKDSAPWNTKNIVGIVRFLDKVERLFTDGTVKRNKNNEETMKLLHKTIKKVGEDIENYKFNTAIASLMILVNNGLPQDEKLADEWKNIFVRLLHPFAPFLAEELWWRINDSHPKLVSGSTKDSEINLEGHSSIFFSNWPEYDEKMIVDNKIKIAVQVLGKVRGTIEISKDEDKQSVLEKAKNEENVKKYLEGKEIKKEIYVPGKIVNFVI